MAVAYITPAKTTISGVAHIPNPNELSDAFEFTEVGTDGGFIASAFDGSTHAVTEELNEKHCFIILHNTTSGDSAADVNVAFKAGDSYAACNDLTVKVEAGKYHFIVVDSAYFKIVNGDTGLGAIKVVPAAAGVEMTVLQVR